MLLRMVLAQVELIYNKVAELQHIETGTGELRNLLP